MKCLKPFSVLLCSLFVSAPTLALKDDHSQPIKVTSNSTSADIQNYTLVYSGNVKIVQGSMVISADELKVVSSATPGNEVMIATGRPATYSQKMDNGVEAKAQANEIRYEVKNRELILNGDAKLSQGASQMQGNSISYNVEKQKLLAEGKKDEQITTIFMPADPSGAKQ